MSLACKVCKTPLDLTLTRCPVCGAGAPVGRLTALLGLVCGRCEAYNDPGSVTCMACGSSLGFPSLAPHGASPEPALRAPDSPGPRPPERAPPEPPVPEPLPAPRRPSLGPADHEPSPPRRAPAPRAPLPPLPEEPLPLAPPPLLPATPPHPPALAVDVRLVVERGEVPPGNAYPLAEGSRVELGGAGADLAFPRDPCLSRHHATISVQQGAVYLRDEGTAGGTFVRLRGLTLPLSPGALFAVGDRLLRFAGSLPPCLPPAADGTVRLGSPRPAGPAALVEERLVGGVTGRTHLRAGPSVTIGRSGCAINLGDDPFVSQSHAELLLDADGGARLRDLASSNGTFVRLPAGNAREMRDGDRVRLGHQVLRVEIG